MWTEWIGAASVISLGTLVFGRFEEGTPFARRALRWAVYLAGVVWLTRRVGRPWSLLWTFGAPAPGIAFHVWWCWRHGIHPLTAEPRAKYRALRGWSPDPAHGEAGRPRQMST